MASNNECDVISTGDYLEKRTLTWRIDNFDDIRRSEGLIRSQVIRFNMGDNFGFPTEWTCFLLPKTEENTNKELRQVGIYLRLEKPPPGAKEVICSFKVTLNKINYSLGPFVKNFMDDFKSAQRRWGWANFIGTDTPSESILTNGSLVLELEAKLYSTDPSRKFTTADAICSAYMPKFAAKLHHDFDKMLVEPVKGSNSETKIISKDGDTFAVIRGILAARSPVFERMLQSDMEESRTGIINITDLSSETISVLLQFIYTGTLTDSWSSEHVLPELFHAAGKYQLPDLLGFLDEVAGVACSKENAGRLVGHARRLGLKQAEKEVVGFMRKHLVALDDIIAFAEDCTVSNFA